MELLKSIALALALITTFSVYGPSEPVVESKALEVNYIPSGLHSIDRIPNEDYFAKEPVLEIIASEDVAEEPTEAVEPTKPTETAKPKQTSGKKNNKESTTNSSTNETTKKPTEESKPTESTKNPTTETENPTAETEKPTAETKNPTKTEVTYFDVPLSEDLQDYIFELCESYDIDPAVIVAVIWKESSYRVSVMGDNGRAYGLMQIQPRWHKDRMKRLGVDDLLDPYQNVLVGIDYLSELYHKKDSIKWALMAYNGGPDYATKKLKAGEISSYASSVLKKAKELEQ